MIFKSRIWSHNFKKKPKWQCLHLYLQVHIPYMCVQVIFFSLLSSEPPQHEENFVVQSLWGKNKLICYYRDL